VYYFENIQHHYCEFLGVGDIYIENEVVVFKSLQLADDDDESDGGNQTNDDNDCNCVNEAEKSSPTNPGTQKLAQLTIEGKRVTPDDSCAIGQF